MIVVRPAPREHMPWLAERAGLVVTPDFRAIEAVDGGRIVGMVGYDGWTPNSCSMHVAIEEPIAVRRLVRPAFALPFMEFRKNVVLGSVLEGNDKSLALSLHLGFSQWGFLPDAWMPGVGIRLLGMQRADCRWLR